MTALSPRHAVAPWWSFGAALAALAAPDARAQGLLAAPTDTVVIEQLDRLIVDEGDHYALYEEFWIRGTARRFVLSEAFDAVPELEAAPDPLFARLELGTQVLPPRHRAIEDRVFGPSVLTSLLQKWRQADAVPTVPPPPLPAVRLPLVPADAALFTEPVRTATKTGQRSLPSELTRFLAARELATSADRILRVYPEQGALVAWTVEVPEGVERFVLGPIRYRLPKPIDGLPRLSALAGVGTQPLGGTLERTFVLSTRAEVPDGPGLVVDPTPWASTLDPDQLRVSYARTAPPIVMSALLDARPAGRFLTRTETRVKLHAARSSGLHPAPLERALPSSGKRGGWLDVLLVLMLGVAPLLITPEAWLCLWAASNANAARRPGEGPGLLGQAWALYAIVVAVYWFATQDGTGRLAAVLPLLFGLWRLAVPPEAERERRVRLNMRARQRPDGSPSEAPGASRSPAGSRPAPASKSPAPPKPARSSAPAKAPSGPPGRPRPSKA